MRPSPLLHLMLGLGLCAASALGQDEGQNQGQNQDCCDRPVRLNELRVAHPGTPENNEFFELTGAPGTSLDCLFLVVIGGGGVVNDVVPLWGNTLDAGGLFLGIQGGYDPAFLPAGVAPDLIDDLSFPNGGNQTFMLVCDCEGLAELQGGKGDVDLDQNDDGVLDAPPWDCVLDCIALIADPAGPPWYCGVTRGPTPGGNAPPHVYRCDTGGPFAPWRMGQFPLAPVGLDTPRTPNPACPPLPVFGLGHVPLGGAQLEPVPGGLLISNIGSSGEDGVLIDVGAAEFLCVQPGPMDVTSDASVTFTGYGDTTDEEDVELAQLVVTGGANSSLAINAAIMGGPVVLKLYDDGEFGDCFDLGPFDDIIILDIPDFPTGPVDIGGHGNGPLRMSWDTGVDHTFIVPGAGGPIVADTIEFSTHDPIDAQLEQVSMTGTSVAAMTIAGEMLGKFGHGHGALGEAMMETTIDTMTINNIGSSGLDGVCIDLGAVSEARVQWDASDVGLAGAMVKVDAAGLFDGEEDHPLGSTWTKAGAGGSFGIAANYDEVGSSTFLLRVFNGEDLVAEFPGSTSDSEGFLATMEAAPRACSKGEYEIVIPGFPPIWWPCFLWDWDTDLPFDINNGIGPGGDEVVGDGLAIIAENPDGSLAFIDRFDIRATNMAKLTIVDETTTPVGAEPDCPADLSGDGIVDGTDLGMLLASWGDGGDADLNGDGEVNGADLGALLAAWGACP